MFPNSLSAIANYTFSACYSLESVVIPASVTSIGDFAFNYCSGLKSVKSLNQTPPDCQYSSFSSVPRDCVLHVPAESVNAYRTATGWMNFYYIEGDVPTSVRHIECENPAFLKARYDLNGKLVGEEYRGIVIEVLSDGSSVKRMMR